MAQLDLRNTSHGHPRASGSGQQTIGGDSWASYSDLIAGVLLIFIFVTVLKDVEIQALVAEPAEALQGWKRALDELCEDEELRSKGLRLDCDTGIIELPNKLLFDFNSTQVKPEGQTLLREVVPLVLEKLRAQTEIWRRVKVEIRGHTDPQGSKGEDPYKINLALSAERAENVLLFLASDSDFSEQDKADVRNRSVASGAAYTQRPDACAILSQKDCFERMRRVEMRLILDDQEIRTSLLELLVDIQTTVATTKGESGGVE